MVFSPMVKRTPEKIVEIDETVTLIIMKNTFQGVRLKDQSTAKVYRISRTPVKKSLQMIGD